MRRDRILRIETGARLLVVSAISLAISFVVIAVAIPAAGIPPADLEAAISRVWAAVLLAAFVGALVAGVVALLLERTITRPLAELTRRAAASGADARSFAVDGPDEVRRLGRALEAMAADARAARRTIERERDRLATLVEGLSDAVVILDPDERIRLANPAAERMLGIPALVGRRLVDCARDHEIFAAVTAARQSGEAQSQIERDVPRRFVRVVARQLADAQMLLSLQDLTLVHRSEAVRREFVANVSHELRTPIASLAAMAETLEAGAVDDPAAARDFVQRMQAELADLAQLVEELLTLARVESGSEPLRVAPLAPEWLIEEAVRRLTTLAGRARVELLVERPVPDGPVLADADRLGQVLSNLVHNAVKFTPPEGRVTLGARDEGRSVRFFVRDTGAGMDETVLPRVFERFYKSDRSRAGGGTGLGLAIAKHIVLAHGGTIEAQSAGPDRGSTFTFTVPRA